MPIRKRLKNEWENFSHDMKIAWKQNPYLVVIIFTAYGLTLPLIATGYYEWLEERRRKNATALDLRLRK